MRVEIANACVNRSASENATVPVAWGWAIEENLGPWRTSRLKAVIWGCGGDWSAGG